MDRFYWNNSLVDAGFSVATESPVITVNHIGIYEEGAGASKSTQFACGELRLTTHRFIWLNQSDSISSSSAAPPSQICMHLSSVKCVVPPSSSSSSLRLDLVTQSDAAQLSEFILPDALLNQTSPIARSSSANQIRLCMRRSSKSQIAAFHTALNETLSAKTWLATAQQAKKTYGFARIEQNLRVNLASNQASINLAFQDLQNLMKHTREMVALSKKITDRLAHHNSASATANDATNVGEDDAETLRLKSALLSMGIADPVTRAAHQSESAYTTQLAAQIAQFLTEQCAAEMAQNGGVMSLAEAFCRINRARGAADMVSAEDLLAAAHKLNQSAGGGRGGGAALRMRTFDSGVRVFQLAAVTDERSVEETMRLAFSAPTASASSSSANRYPSISAEELSRIVPHLPAIIAKEQLLLCEKAGRVVRDDSIQGLRFYVNKFLDD